MADERPTSGPKLPGTDMVIIERYPGTGTRRLDHPDFGDVYETTYGEGVIKDFGLKTTDPIVLDGTCTVEVAGKTAKGIPIFYHCRKGGPPVEPPPPPPVPEEYKWIYDIIESVLDLAGDANFGDDGAGFLEDTGSLKCGAWAFWKEQKVKVLLQKRIPKCVVGHAKPSKGATDIVPGEFSPAYWEAPQVAFKAPEPPYKCHNIFRIVVWDWMSGRGYMIPTGKGTKQKQGFSVRMRKTYGNTDEDPLKDQYNKNINLNLVKKVYRLFGYRELQRGTSMLYFGDWLIKLGAVMFIFQVKAIGWPAPSTADITILAALYDKGLEQSAIANGKRKEADLVRIPRLGGGVSHFGPFIFESMKYEYLAGADGAKFIKQRDFSNYLLGYYRGQKAGMYGGGTPRWVYTEMYTEPIGYTYGDEGESGGGGGGGGGGG